MQTLHITTKKKWFDMENEGIKLEEYREITPYWISRLFEIEKPLTIKGFNIYYDKIDRMFNFANGLKHSRSEALDFLIEQGCISLKHFEIISNTNGYGYHRPNIKWKHLGTTIGTGKPEWGAEPGKNYFILKIGELI